MTGLVRIVSLLAFVVLVAGCGRPFDVKTAPGFVELQHQSVYDYRATSPEGVVVGVRVIEDEDRGDLAFWTQALTIQLRDVAGYALVETTDAASRDGTRGKLLKLGRDEGERPFVFWVTIYPAQGRLILVEAGGPQDAFERARPNVEWMLASVRVR